jgi:hypothetical protein
LRECQVRESEASVGRKVCNPETLVQNLTVAVTGGSVRTEGSPRTGWDNGGPHLSRRPERCGPRSGKAAREAPGKMGRQRITQWRIEDADTKNFSDRTNRQDSSQGKFSLRHTTDPIYVCPRGHDHIREYRLYCFVIHVFRVSSQLIQCGLRTKTRWQEDSVSRVANDHPRSRT